MFVNGFLVINAADFSDAYICVYILMIYWPCRNKGYADPPTPHLFRSGYLVIEDAQNAEKIMGVIFQITSYRVWAPRESKRGVLVAQKFNCL